VSVEPPLVRGDLFLLTMVLVSRADKDGVRLDELMGRWDEVNRSYPSLDDLSFGLPRLAAHGLVEVHGSGVTFRIHPTLRARSAAHGSWRDTSWTVLERLEEAFADVTADREDRGLGRQPGLNQADVDAAIVAYRVAFDRSARPLLAVVAALRRMRILP
jgi:hypothetical protein